MSNKLRDKFVLSSHRHGWVLSDETRERMSKAQTGRIITPEHRARIAESRKGQKHTEETKYKISVSLSGENHPFYGRRHTEKSKMKMSAIKTGEMNPNYGILFTPEHRARLSESNVGKNSGQNHGNWKGGISFEPYCEKFDFQLKEDIRNRDERRCQLCGKSEILNGQRLSVHHIDSDKMNTDPSNLAALCLFCNSETDTLEKEFLLSAGGDCRE